MHMQLLHDLGIKSFICLFDLFCNTAIVQNDLELSTFIPYMHI